MSTLTNKYNAPLPLVAAVSRDNYDPGNCDITVTGLIKPPRIRQLEIRHDDRITEDVSDRIWAMDGQATHYILEQAMLAAKDMEFHIRELRLFAQVAGWTISGGTDLFMVEQDGKNVVVDYKRTSVFSFLLGDKIDWEQQLNSYSWLWETQTPYNVDTLQIVGLLRDWSKAKARQNKDWPPAPFATKDIPLWPLEQRKAWLEERVLLHQLAESLPDSELPYCEPHERWARPDTWAVMKKGRKTAMRVLDTKEEATTWADAATVPGVSVQHRPGASVRCEDYCVVRDFCNQYKEMQQNAK